APQPRQREIRAARPHQRMHVELRPVHAVAVPVHAVLPTARAPSAQTMPGLMRSVRSGFPIPDWHHEREFALSHVARWTGEWVGAPDQRQRLVVEDGRSGAAHNVTRHDVTTQVDAERDTGDALLATGARWIALE